MVWVLLARPSQVRSSFAGAEVLPDKKKTAGNPLWIRKGFAAVWLRLRPEKPCARPPGADNYLMVQAAGMKSSEYTSSA